MDDIRLAAKAIAIEEGLWPVTPEGYNPGKHRVFGSAADALKKRFGKEVMEGLWNLWMEEHKVDD